MSVVEKRRLAKSAKSIKTTVIEPNKPQFYASVLKQEVWFTHSRSETKTSALSAKSSRKK
jgi:hypothetical protein